MHLFCTHCTINSISDPRMRSKISHWEEWSGGKRKTMYEVRPEEHLEEVFNFGVDRYFFPMKQTH